MASANPFGGFGGFGSTGNTATTTQNSFQLTSRPLFGQPQTTTGNLGEAHVVKRKILLKYLYLNLVRKGRAFTGCNYWVTKVYRVLQTGAFPYTAARRVLLQRNYNILACCPLFIV
jgi:hypothetical protein